MNRKKMKPPIFNEQTETLNDYLLKVDKGDLSLIDFFADLEDGSNDLHSVLRDVAAALGDKAKVIKIDI